AVRTAAPPPPPPRSPGGECPPPPPPRHALQTSVRRASKPLSPEGRPEPADPSLPRKGSLAPAGAGTRARDFRTVGHEAVERDVPCLPERDDELAGVAMPERHTSGCSS